MRAHRGQALIPVLLAMLLLVAVAVTLAARAHDQARASANFVEQVEDYYAAKGALNYAISSLEQTSNNGATYGVVQPDPSADQNGWWQIGDLWVKVMAVDTASRININQVDLNTLEQLPVFAQNPDLAQAIIDWRTAATTTNAQPTSDQSTQQQGGTENYESLPTPYDNKGAPFDTVGELLLVQGMTPSILYGTVAGTPAAAGQTLSNTTTNSLSTSSSTTTSRSVVGRYGNAVRTRQSLLGGGTANGGGTAGGTGTNGSNSGTTGEDFSDIYQNSTLPLAQLFTTVSRELNVASDGTQRININTATEQDLEQQLNIPANIAQAIVNYRQGGGGAAGGNGGGAAGAAANATSHRQARPGGGGGGPRPGGAGGGPGGGPRPGGVGGGPGGNGGNGGGPRPGGGPGGGGNPRPGGGPEGGGAAGGGGGQFTSIGDLLKVQGVTTALMQQIADKITVDNNTYRENVVDVNTAPPEVLAMVPGMSRDLLNAIVQYRQSGQAFQGLGDLFSLQVSNDELENAIGSLSTKGADYIIHILVRRQGSPRVYAVSALVEFTPNGPQVLQWREVQRAPGWYQWNAPPVLPLPSPSGSSASGTNMGTYSGGGQ